jgi:hypothetical protein
MGKKRDFQLRSKSLIKKEKRKKEEEEKSL